MSDLEKKLTEKKEQIKEKVGGEIAKLKRSLATRMGRAVAWCLICLVILVMVLFGTFAWYSKTDDFNRRVGREVVKILEDATGGRVELRGISFAKIFQTASSTVATRKMDGRNFSRPRGSRKLRSACAGLSVWKCCALLKSVSSKGFASPTRR